MACAWWDCPNPGCNATADYRPGDRCSDLQPCPKCGTPMFLEWDEEGDHDE